MTRAESTVLFCELCSEMSNIKVITSGCNTFYIMLTKQRKGFYKLASFWQGDLERFPGRFSQI